VHGALTTPVVWHHHQHQHQHQQQPGKVGLPPPLQLPLTLACGALAAAASAGDVELVTRPFASRLPTSRGIFQRVELVRVAAAWHTLCSRAWRLMAAPGCGETGVVELALLRMLSRCAGECERWECACCVALQINAAPLAVLPEPRASAAGLHLPV
jgi:hypothetical protein